MQDSVNFCLIFLLQSCKVAMLLDAFARGSCEEALYYTCVYIHRREVEALENTWIELSAAIGERLEMPYYQTWTHVNQRLLHLIEDDCFHIRDALEMTSMLLLLYLRVKESSKIVATNVKLKKQILEQFPEGSVLSYRGQEVFRRILPAATSDTHAFCHRVLAGLTRLMDAGEWRYVRDALEYIHKKKLAIPLPHVWPCPDEKEAQKGHPCWFLWGALLCAVSDPNVATNWKLYSWNWRPSYRKTRAGLLMGVVHLASKSNAVEPIWTAKEGLVIDKVKQHAVELWAEVRQREPPQDAAVEASCDSSDELTGIHQLAHIMPRQSYAPRPQPSMHETEEKPRLIDVTHRYKDSASKGVQKPKIKKVGDNHEAGNTDSRHRWLDFGEKGF